MRRFALLVSLTAAFLGSACVNVPLYLLGKTQPLEETQVRRSSAKTSRKVVVIPIDGPIVPHGERSVFGGGEGTLLDLTEAFDKAQQDPDVAAVVLRINSPGGDVTTTDILAERIRAFRRATGKPVVAALTGMAASGGYYLACASDRIVAHPTCVVGSIGVIMQLVKLEGLAGKIGIELVTIKSGRVKDLGNPFRAMSAEEQAILQKLIDGMYQRFVDVVAQGRGLERAQVLPLAEGQVYTAEDARKHKLVDDIGYLDEAIELAIQMSGAGAANVVMYNRVTEYAPTVYARMSSPGPDLNAPVLDADALVRLASPGFYYLWAPGR